MCKIDGVSMDQFEADEVVLHGNTLQPLIEKAN